MENPVGMVHGRRDERLWAEAKKQVSHQYPRIKKGSDRYWAIVNRVFTRMKYRIGGGEMPETNPCHASGVARNGSPFAPWGEILVPALVRDMLVAGGVDFAEAEEFAWRLDEMLEEAKLLVTFRSVAFRRT